MHKPDSTASQASPVRRRQFGHLIRGLALAGTLLEPQPGNTGTTDTSLASAASTQSVPDVPPLPEDVMKEVEALQARFGFLSPHEVIRAIRFAVHPDGSIDHAALEEIERDRKDREDGYRMAAPVVTACAVPPEVQKRWEIEFAITDAEQLLHVRRYQLNVFILTQDTVQPDEEEEYGNHKRIIEEDIALLLAEVRFLEEQRDKLSEATTPDCASGTVPKGTVMPGYYREAAHATLENRLQHVDDTVDPRELAEVAAIMEELDPGVPFIDLAKKVGSFQRVDRAARLGDFLSENSEAQKLAQSLAKPGKFSYMLSH